MVAIQLAILLIVCIAYRFVSAHVRERRFRAFEAQHGCESATDLTVPWYGRVQHLQRMMKAGQNKEDLLDDIIAERFNRAYTHQARGFDGSLNMGTIDPANIQAMLATQFKDFETGQRRYQTLAPVIGKSIFSSDGAFCMLQSLRIILAVRSANPS
ncbi:hypothetical protein BAUCODRAFT_238317 [Baudoinia panamericana UAMH 10762]|uniref:Uncharacterized protein n=1 Tax=Baudoinia panamericana (strain UAMH 10762) TaxID=717646 RepID=M2MA60_BAUPA|nr:uncharacterized protein BAUCODRAFT_238317 [Baudoinia panamericana UAMH 10762]EMC93361.1 hypothetical protein BAUCODRAFT_238317 [Baudoinia panamericana UAMH 10762]